VARNQLKVGLKTNINKIIDAYDDTDEIKQRIQIELDEVFSLSNLKKVQARTKVQLLMESLDTIYFKNRDNIDEIDRLTLDMIQYQDLAKKYLKENKELRERISELEFQNLKSESVKNQFKMEIEDIDRNCGELKNKPLYERETINQKEEGEIHEEKSLYSEELLESPHFEDSREIANDHTNFEENKEVNYTFFGPPNEETSHE
jgi:hypothetical protein